MTIGWPVIISINLLVANITAIQASEFDISQDTYRRVEERYGIDARRRIERWRDFISDTKDYSDENKIEAVNRFFNELIFVSDAEHWNRSDYWATPLEFLATNGGDCEDFSIAKYFTLSELGIPVDKLRLTYVKSLKLNQAHMVLTYFPDHREEPLVLDNLVKEIRPASLRNDLLPIYSFSGEGLWLAKERSRGKLIGKAGRLKRWKNLNDRMARQYKKLGAIK